MQMPQAAPGAFAPVCRLVPARASFEVDRPSLFVDVDRGARQYFALKRGLGFAQIHSAAKANPTGDNIERLVAEGAHFDAASRAETELCLSQGAEARTIFFGNTIKKPGDIRFAHPAGVTLFAADAAKELKKIAETAPGAEVCIRVLVENTQADWPLSRKFGCRDAMLPGLFARAVDRAGVRRALGPRRLADPCACNVDRPPGPGRGDLARSRSARRRSGHRCRRRRRRPSQRCCGPSSR